MATKTTNASSNPLDSSNREWDEFAFDAFSRIVARKHGIVVPFVDMSSLSDEELRVRVRMLSEMAHLPPA